MTRIRPIIKGSIVPRGSILGGGILARKLYSETSLAANGYFGGGVNTANNLIGVIDRLDFSSDATTMVTTTSMSTSTLHCGSFNSNRVGYWTGGNDKAMRYARTEGLTFASDTSAMVTKGVLAEARDDGASVNSTTIGYFAGGKTQNGGETIVNTNEGLTFASDTTAQVTKGALSATTYHLGAANSSTSGYFSGGRSDASTFVTTSHGLTFASDTTTMITKGALSIARELLAGANSSTKAYFAGGDSTGSANYVATNDALTFSTDTTNMVTRGALTQTVRNKYSCNSTDYAYFAGGQTGATIAGVLDTNDRLDFSSDSTTMVTKGQTSLARRGGTGVQSGGIF